MSLRKLVNEMAGIKPKGKLVGFTRLDEAYDEGNKFWVVMHADHPDLELLDIIAEVTMSELADMVRGSTRQETQKWELYPHSHKAQAYEEANRRLEMAIRSKDPFLNLRRTFHR